VIEDNKEDDTPKLDYRDVEQVLRVSGVDEITTEQVERAFCNVIDDQSYEFKARSIMPKYTSKSIKINTKVATISVSPQDLRYVKQVIHNGKRCLLIEVDEDTVIEGFTLSSETL
jgi:Flp pilus assembly protein CpaB